MTLFYGWLEYRSSSLSRSILPDCFINQLESGSNESSRRFTSSVPAALPGRAGRAKASVMFSNGDDRFENGAGGGHTM